MKTHWMLSAIAVATIACTTISAARAGERGGMGGGPIQHILDAAKELNLTEDQKTKLHALAKELGATHDPAAMKEKFKNNPAMLETLKEMKAARESGDETKLKELRAKLMASGGEGGAKGEGVHGEIVQKLMQILTPEQMKKLKEMRENAGERKGIELRPTDGDKGNDKGNNKSNKPDASKGVPVPFE